MPYIIIPEQYSQGQRIQECGMLWAAAIKKWARVIKLKDVIQEHKTAKIERELLSIKWGNFIIQWAPNMSKRLFMHFN